MSMIGHVMTYLEVKNELKRLLTEDTIAVFKAAMDENLDTLNDYLILDDRHQLILMILHATATEMVDKVNEFNTRLRIIGCKVLFSPTSIEIRAGYNDSLFETIIKNRTEV